MFLADLTEHDSYLLATRKPSVFLWAVRDAGTWLHLDNSSIDWRRAEVQSGGGAVQYFIGQQTGLREITAQQYVDYKFAEDKCTPSM